MSPAHTSASGLVRAEPLARLFRYATAKEPVAMSHSKTSSSEAETPISLVVGNGQGTSDACLVRRDIPRGQLLIGGRWVDAEAGETMSTVDPTTEAVITEVQKGSATDTQKAIDAASRAFEDGPWGRMRHEDRAKILFRIADLLDERP